MAVSTTQKSSHNVSRGIWELARLHTREAWLCWYPAIWGACVAASMRDVSLELAPFLRLLFGIWASVTATHCTFCTFNDICDQKLDIHVERCKVRPLPAGMISTSEAVVAFICWLPVTLSVTWGTLGPAVTVGFIPVWVLSTIYPFMKRIMPFPQVVLGAIIGGAVFPGWVGITGDLRNLDQALPLFFATAAWVVYFDIFYATQDRPDDEKIGVKSLAVLMGKNVQVLLAVLGVLQVLLFAVTALRAEMSLIFWVLGLVKLLITMNRIDVHHHFIPPAYVNASNSTPGDPSGWHLPKWTPESTLSLMASHTTRTAILSLTAPGTSIISNSPVDSATLARQINLYGFQLHQEYPTRFGFFASLPHLTSETITSAIEELAYALDILQADGITLYTRYSGTGYLGHIAFAPLWEELNHRKAVVFIHPTNTASDVQIQPVMVNPNLPQPILDYPHETCRAAVDLITSGTISKNPNVKIILSHGGGTLPILATRAANLLYDAGLTDITPERFLEQARGFYFDLALSGNQGNLELLVGKNRFAKTGHVLYGSDFPYAPVETINKYVEMMEDFFAHGGEKEEIARGAAVELFPRFQIEEDNKELL
ncbi:Amidohydrolase 2 [Penicillium cf. griseofulvum]|uniref:6-methylsalicylate decarboxylase n=1 Tax=Penicillium cf. griseofulvum TaxID=2972120 RepID=A0A9W9M229_9EURO|nr:Amidohydrolase 2 [Penicillium cf. griseofulvum]